MDVPLAYVYLTDSASAFSLSALGVTVVTAGKVAVETFTINEHGWLECWAIPLADDVEDRVVEMRLPAHAVAGIAMI